MNYNAAPEVEQVEKTKRAAMKSHVLLIAIAYFAFFTLGVPDGLLGVAWPSIRDSFGLPLDAFGLLLTSMVTGYFLSTFNSGRIVSRFGVVAFLIAGCVISGVGLVGFALSPAWPLTIFFGFMLGLGAGGIDAGMNTYIAVNYSAGVMNWLHAFFGLGATVGPLIMTTILSMGYYWGYGYIGVGALRGLILLCFFATLDRWQNFETGPDENTPGSRKETVSAISTLRLPIVWSGIAMFVVFVGIEATAGQWSYTLFTEARSVSPEVAGICVGMYWGNLTAGRMVFGLLVNRMGVTKLLRMCMAGSVCGSALIWLNAANFLSFAGLALVGLSIAPLFPCLISIVPGRIGVGHAANAIGFQMGAASIGYAVLPGLSGVLAENFGLEVIGPLLLVSSLVMALLLEQIVRN